MTGGQFGTLESTGARGRRSLTGGGSLNPGIFFFDLGGTSVININPFLGNPAAAWCRDFAHIVGLTTTIAAHELGHLYGSPAQDAFARIGTGIFSGVNPGGFSTRSNKRRRGRHRNVSLTSWRHRLRGTTAARRGPDRLISAKRDDVKLAFNGHGITLQAAILTSAPPRCPV